MERRLEQLQSQYDLHLNLNEDEITRLAEYLEQVKGDIVEMRDKLNRFKYQSEQAMQEEIGIKMDASIKKKTIISRIQSEHESYIEGMNKHHLNVVQQIHDDFDASLAEIQQNTEAAINQKVSGIDQSIRKVQRQIEIMKNSVQTIQKEEPAEDLQTTSRIQQAELERIKTLESSIKDKNKDRLSNLIKAKENLSRCVATLEDIEHEHRQTMDQYKTKLEALDSNYQQNVQTTMENHKHQLEAIARKVDTAEKAAQAIEKKINEDTSRHQERMIEMSQNVDQYRSNITSISYKTVQKKETKDLQNALSRVEEVRTLLSERETLLFQERKINDELKREISRLRDEAIIRQRRAALNIF